ncbi:Uncharacterized protein HZ326_10705 [Fusarium oxysporum f. sp. albedinis]|nr:Uncharacterized protein HZ326_10705 [Fusarium oxysporum f. sp. albedinis]
MRGLTYDISNVWCFLISLIFDLSSTHRYRTSSVWEQSRRVQLTFTCRVTLTHLPFAISQYTVRKTQPEPRPPIPPLVSHSRPTIQEPTPVSPSASRPENLGH